ncbi:hypothetical protein NPX79_02595 [Spiroplasma endosymbiont of Anurida maritima]|uniref:hypothetical protein n=1 Tax=Spiroplasma endosymbiont of Anurida maritima TaxID=2967972 RepID=UPI0036D3FCD8
MDKLKINIPPENQNEFDNVIEKLYDSLNRMINAYSYTEFIGNKIFSSSNKDKSFSLDGKSENINNLILEIVKSADYFGKMVDLTTNFDTKEYDILAGKDFAKAISEQMGVFSSFLWPQTEAFLAIIDKIIQNGAFPIKEFGAGTSELFSIFTEKNTDGDIVLNYDMFNKIKEIVNYQKNHPNDKSFTKSLTEIDMTGKYYKKILKNYGLDEKTDMYKDGSLFNIFYKWSHDPNSSMYKAFKKLFNTKGNFLSDLIMESERIINEKSFELLFRDDFWNIKAMGEGVDGSKLGWNKDKTELKYQLDYFGPKDASVDLNLHQEKLLYYDTDENTHKDDGFESFGEDDGFESFGEDDSFSDPFFQSEPTKNMKDIPKILKNMSETSLMKYDGKANEYLKESKDIKYSYVVTFTNLNGKTKTKEQNWKFIDFKWFYNNKRYY